MFVLLILIDSVDTERKNALRSKMFIKHIIDLNTDDNTKIKCGKLNS